MRQALGGLADATGLSPADLNDIGIAVTEACNNASVHAYDGAEGPLRVEVHAGETFLRATVRDYGVGVGVDVSEASFPTDLDGELLGIGLPSIQGLADHVQWSEPSDGGTLVEMQFSVDMLSWTGEGAVADVERPAITAEDLPNTIEVGMAPLAVTHGVLPRVLRASAARAGFSFERHSAAQRVVTMLLADVSSWALSGAVQARLVVTGGSIELAVGPMTPAAASRLASAAFPIAPRLSASVVDLSDGGQRAVVRLER